MASIQFDLTGTKGLAPRFQGNKPDNSASPQNIYLGTDGQLAGGVWDPISNFGYITPANDTLKAVTGGPTLFQFGATLLNPYRISQATDAIFFAEDRGGGAGSVYNLDTAIDTSFDTAYTFPSFTGVRFYADIENTNDLVQVPSDSVSGANLFSIAQLGIANGSALKYVSATGSGLTLNTVYYVNNVGAIAADKFSLCSDAGLTTPVVITNNVGAVQFETYSTSMDARVDDMIMYQKNGIPKIYFSRRNTTTEGKYNSIGVADPDFSNVQPTFSIDFMTGGTPDMLSSTGRIMFVLADNGLLYVLNGNQILQIDGGPTAGSTGSIAQSLLFLGQSQTAGVNTITRIQDAADIRGKMWVALHVNPSMDLNAIDFSDTGAYGTYVGIYIWDKNTTVVGDNNFVAIPGAKQIKSVHNLGGTPMCFTVSYDGYTELRVWNGNSFQIKQTLGKFAYPTYRRHSVYEAGDYIMWLGYDGKIYAYGSIEPGSPVGLYTLGDITTHLSGGEALVNAGTFLCANSAETNSGNYSPLGFYLSYQTTSAVYHKKWYPFVSGTVATVAQTAHAGNIYSLVKYLPTVSRLRRIDIMCLPKGSSGDTTTVATLKIFCNQSTTPSFTKTITRNDISKGYLTYELNKPYVSSVQLKIEYDTAQTKGSNDFNPSFATLTYDTTGTR